MLPFVSSLLYPSWFLCEQAEGIFRINAENSEEELVREQLNRGIIPDGIDVHCLAGLIKVCLFNNTLCINLLQYISSFVCTLNNVDIGIHLTL